MRNGATNETEQAPHLTKITTSKLLIYEYLTNICIEN